jgi:hypothetical protein
VTGWPSGPWKARPNLAVVGSSSLCHIPPKNMCFLAALAFSISTERWSKLTIDIIEWCKFKHEIARQVALPFSIYFPLFSGKKKNICILLLESKDEYN